MKATNGSRYAPYDTEGPYTPEMVSECVQRGIRYLDERCPDWFEKIDQDELDMQSPYWCMLGQTANCIIGPYNAQTDYHRAGYSRILVSMSNVGIPDTATSWAKYHGFNIRFGGGYSRTRWEMLRLAWIEAIKERLGES